MSPTKKEDPSAITRTEEMMFYAPKEIYKYDITQVGEDYLRASNFYRNVFKLRKVLGPSVYGSQEVYYKTWAKMSKAMTKIARSGYS